MEQCMVAYAAESQPAKPTHGGTASMLTFVALLFQAQNDPMDLNGKKTQSSN